MPTTESQTTKALEWAVERISAASQSGWWIDRLTALSSSVPAYKSPAYKSTATATVGGNHTAAAEEARRQAARAEAAADGLRARVTALESELADLRQRHDELAAHLEAAVGPSSEGAHKQHWWSRRG